MRGPGGQDFFRDGEGGLWMSLHGWIDPRIGASGVRALWLLRMSVEAGVPRLAVP
jgi:hypothetical protein